MHYQRLLEKIEKIILRLKKLKIRETIEAIMEDINRDTIFLLIYRISLSAKIICHQALLNLQR